MLTVRHVAAEPASSALIKALEMANSDASASSLELQHGTFRVIADTGVLTERLNDFGRGGIVPAGRSLDLDSYRLTEVQNSSAQLSQLVRRSMPAASVYIHEPLKHLHEVPYLDFPVVTITGQLFYVRDTETLSDGDLSTFISRNTHAWHFLMLCTSSRINNPVHMQELLAECEIVVCGVYDGESYLVWSRGSNAQTPPHNSSIR